VTRHRTLSEQENQPDVPWNPWVRHAPRGFRPRDLPLSALDCWCGGPFEHDWIGKADGAPHPRDMKDPSMSSPTPIYRVESDDFPEGRVVTLDEWIEFERLAGFSGPGHFSVPARPATAGFSGKGYRGLIRYAEEDE
jgi:hypothetical protein